MLNCQKKLNKINWFVTYMICICRFKKFGQSPVQGRCYQMFFKKQESFNFFYLLIVLMHGGEFIACCKDKIIVSSSSSNVDYYKSFGADQEQAPEAQASNHDAGLLKCDATTSRGSLYNRMHLPSSTRPSGRTTFQYKFVLLPQ